jgi:hypothetical protein
MSVYQDKLNIFSKLGALTTLQDQASNKNLTKSFSTITAKSNDSVTFLLDVLKTIVGSESLKVMVGGLLTTFFSGVENQMKSSLKNQFVQQNSSSPLPSSFTNGYEIPLSSIDAYGKFKIPAGSVSDGLKFNAVPDFDVAVKNSILNSGSSQTYGAMSMQFNDITQKIKFSPSAGSSGLNIGNWFTNYVEQSSFINKSEAVTKILDSIFGTMTKSEAKSINQVIDELAIQEALDNAINGTNNTLDLATANNIANNIISGSTEYNMGCGYIYSQVTEADFANTVNDILNTNDPTTVANILTNSVLNNTNNSTANNNIINNNASSINDNFFTHIINALKNELIKSFVLSPQIMALKNILKVVTTGETAVAAKATDYIAEAKTFIQCMSKEIVSMLSQYIYAIVLSELTKILTPIIEKLIKEKATQIKSIIKSLIPKI